MQIAIAKEVKAQEYRVALPPAATADLVQQGHSLLVEQDAGLGSGFSNQDYQTAGAEICSREELFARAELIVKVKEPTLEECTLFKPGQLLFTYLHLAPNPELTSALMACQVSAIAYETVSNDHGQLPLLAPMSQIAGRLAVQAGAFALQRHLGGRGLLMAGVPGVPPAHVVILGAGVVGNNACQIALGMGARVTVLDISTQALGAIEARFDNRAETLYAGPEQIKQVIQSADVIIGAVLVTGAQAPKLISHEMLELIPSGAALVDVAIDQGGCFADSRPSSYQEPCFIVDDKVFYCVANMPAAAARTASQALANASLPYIKQIAGLGFSAALGADKGLAQGLNIHRGKITYQAIAEAQSRLDDHRGEYDYLP